jgi:hypothetical protein
MIERRDNIGKPFMKVGKASAPYGSRRTPSRFSNGRSGQTLARLHDLSDGGSDKTRGQELET